MLKNVKDEPKPKTLFTRKLRKSKIIEALLNQHLMLEEDVITEDRTKPNECVDHDASILVKSTTAKNSNPADIRNITSAVFQKKSNSKTKANKDSTSAKELVIDRVVY